MSLFSFSSKKQTEATSVGEALAGTMSQPSAKSKSRKPEKGSADSDQLVPEKKRARRRLIGAIVMVLAVIIGLPMVLDSEPQVINKNIAIKIPTRDETAISSDAKEEAAQPDTSEQFSKSTFFDESTATTTKSIANRNTVLPSTLAISNLKKESPVRSDKESAKALAILNGSDTGVNSDATASAKTATKISPRVVIQVGAFATQEKVDELRRKLSSAGIKSYTQKVATGSGNKIRVRIGPFDDKESADKVKNKLDKLGLTGKLVPVK